jgi:ABC-type lipoprotein export system ATPase subunit
LLDRITIENYRSCLRTSINLHPRLSVLIGPNGSGKTNILQAFMLLNKMASEERFGRQPKDTLSVNSRIKATFERHGTKTRLNASVDVRTDDSNNDVLVVSRQKWITQQAAGRKKAAFELPMGMAPYHVGEQDRHRISYVNRRYYVGYMHGRFDEPPVPPAWARPSFNQISAYCRGIRYYGASQFTNPGRCPASFQIEREGTHRRRFVHRGHVRILYDMYLAQKTQSRQFDQFMQIVGPGGLKLIDALRFREVETSSVDYSVRVGGRIEKRKKHQLIVIPQFRIGSQRLSPNQLSEGTFKTLALLFHVMTEDSTALLIEEPEVCVHHGLLASILELIKSYSRRKQMILSTHSDYVLDHVKPENVYKVTFDKLEGTKVGHIQEAMTSLELKALREYLEKEGNLGEYWREGGLGDRP